MLFAILLSVYFKCSFYERFSFKRTPKNFVWDALFISSLSIRSFGSFSGESSTLLGLWNNEYFSVYLP